MGRFPFDGAVVVEGDLAKLASETVREGCLAAALAAAAQAGLDDVVKPAAAVLLAA
jgi:hypothetical protein